MSDFNFETLKYYFQEIINKAITYLPLAVYISSGLVILAISAFIVFKIVRYMGRESRRVDKAVKQAEKDPALEEALTNLRILAEQLKAADTDKSLVLIRSAEDVSLALVKLAQGFAKKAAANRHKINVLNEAEVALMEKDNMKIATVAGRVLNWDRVLGQALIDTTSKDMEDSDYIASVAVMVGIASGNLFEWSIWYDRYADSLSKQISIELTRIQELHAALDFVPVASRLVSLEQRLVVAGKALKVERPSVRAGLSTIARELPPGV